MSKEKLNKAPKDYCARTATVRAAKQLHAAGKPARIADYVRYIYIRGPERARAWDLPEPLEPKTIDVPRYGELLLRVADTILQMLGVAEEILHNWVSSEEAMVTQPRLPLIDCKCLTLDWR